MTTIHTVAAVNQHGTIAYLGHHIAGLPCPTCADTHNKPLHLSKCEAPKRHAAIAAHAWAEDGYTIHTLEHSYRQKPCHQLYRKADYAFRTQMGLLNA